MKFRLKSIAIVILGLLILVCSYQVYWLVNFHNQQYQKMETVIKNTIESTTLKELAIRMTYISGEKEEKEENLKVTNKNEVTIHKDSFSSKSHGQASFSMSVSRDSTNGENNSDSLYADLQYLTGNIQRGILSAVASIQPLNMVRFDSILSSDLSAQGLNIPHIIQCKTTEGDSLVNQIPNRTLDIKNSTEYTLDGLKDNTYSYYLYMENPKWHIFKDMWGLVAVSVLMVILMIATYVYLLKIILRQKTIDEIKSDFVNNMTHELKTPISVTYAAVDALQNFGMGDDPEKRDEYLTISREQLMYLNSLVEQILTMSVEERRNLRLAQENIELNKVFENQKNKFLLNASKPVAFTIDIQPIDLKIEADKLHFENVISNLIENAIKYSKESVNIKLSAGQTGNKTIISVTDNGIGIPNSSLNKIFDKFYRVSTGNIHDVKGYGLGLSYVKTIIDKQGWVIKVNSTEGKGTCFKIIIG
ncbi:MAG: HAMP domain-containing histidine kinase [Prevotella sp.]|nr:HAMP domain-containing histidine kinase [Prevotella sp.]